MPAQTPGWKIYQKLLKQCRPYTLPGRWQRWPASRRVHLPPADAEQVLQALLADFAPDSLGEANVVVMDAAQQPQLNPILTESPVLIALLNLAGHNPPGLLTSAGCLPRRWLPVCAAQQASPQMASGLPDVLAVAFSIIDVAVLISLGLPATLAVGLEQMSREQIDEFCRGCGYDRHPPGSPGSGLIQEPVSELAPPWRPLRLLLVGWSPASLSLEKPEGLTEVMAHLRQVHAHLRVGLERMAIWRPSAADLRRLEFCLDHGNLKDVRAALQASMTQSVQSLIDRGQAAETLDQVDPAVVVQRMRQARSAEERRQIWQQYEQQLGQKLVEPLLWRAEESTDPLLRELLVMAANTSRLAHPQAAVIYERLAQSGRSLGSDAVMPLPVGDIKQLLALTARQLSVIRELRGNQSRGLASKRPARKH